MTAASIQGVVFVVLAIVVSALTSLLERVPERTELLVLAGLIVMLGVPHGALDTIFAKQLYNIGTTKEWADIRAGLLDSRDSGDWDLALGTLGLPGGIPDHFDCAFFR